MNNVTMNLEKLNGKAVAVLIRFVATAGKVGWDGQRIAAVIEEATTGDYDHLLETLITAIPVVKLATRPPRTIGYSDEERERRRQRMLDYHRRKEQAYKEKQGHPDA